MSESESREVAKLCMLNDWVSLEFINARRVTFTKISFVQDRLFVWQEKFILYERCAGWCWKLEIVGLSP